jgi:thiol peroxidase
LRIGDQAPEFHGTASDWSSVKALESTHGKVRIIGSLLSLHTSTCDRETKRFNELISELGDDVAILMISMDLPWAHKNWCTAAGVDKVITLSDHKEAEFGEKYGVLLKEPRILRRAIFVIDRDGKVVYADYMPVLGDEPDYAAVLKAARDARSG